MSLVYLAVVAALAAIHAPTQKGPVVVEVRIVVAPRATLEKLCTVGKFAAVDVLVDENEAVNEPYHCPPSKKLLVGHKTAHASDKETLVRISYANKDSVHWQSDTEFSIAKIAPRDPKPKEGTPQSPFENLALLGRPSKSINSGPIISKAAVGYQYKVYISIGKRTIDPDVWCNP